MDKAEQNQAENTVKNGTAPNASEGNTSRNIPGNNPGNTATSSPASSPAESASAEAATPGMEAVQVDAVQIDSARLDSAHSVYSTDLDPDDDYEEVVEEYATTDEPDGTHREERRITRTTHHPRGKGDQKADSQKAGAPKAGTQGNPDGAAEIIDAGEPETHTTTIARSPAPSRTRRAVPRVPACSARSASTAARRTWRRGKNVPLRPCSWRPCCTCSRSPRPS